jgi:class 3 adenylate cyclase
MVHVARSDLIDPTIALHHGRAVKRTGDGSLIEFRSVDAVRCGIEVQTGMVERNAGLPPEKRIEFRIGIHLGDVVEESDGDLMGDGVNIAARLQGVARIAREQGARTFVLLAALQLAKLLQTNNPEAVQSHRGAASA